MADPEHQPSELGAVLQDVLRLAALARPAMARDLGISVSEVWALEHLMSEEMGPVELSRRLDMTSAAATVLVRRLEMSGHVVREPHPADRRRTVLHPTSQAVHAVMGVLGPLLTEFNVAGASLDDSQRAVVVGYLRQVATALGQVVGQPTED